MNINSVTPMSVSHEAASVETMPPPVRSDVEKAKKIQDAESSKQSTEKQESVSAKEAREMVEALNDYMADFQTNLGFYVREDLDHQIVVEIKDSKTDELIKQIPTEAMLIIKEKMEELTGLIFDESV